MRTVPCVVMSTCNAEKKKENKRIVAFVGIFRMLYTKQGRVGLDPEKKSVFSLRGECSANDTWTRRIKADFLESGEGIDKKKK